MPQNSFIVATKTPSSDVFVFDVSKHPSTPEPGAECRPEHRCTGHTEEGYGICWSPHKEGMLLSGSDDKTVCLWDIGSGGETVDSVDIRSGHTDVVEDVSWHGFSEHHFGSVGDDKQLLIWDVREGSNKAKAQSIVKDAHDGDVNSLSFCPHNEFLLVTAGGDRAVKLWDMRNLKAPQHVFEGHKKEVYVVEWCADKNCKTIMASCAADRRVNVWDISRIGQEQAPEDAEDGPPELLFIHGARARCGPSPRGEERSAADARTRRWPHEQGLRVLLESERPVGDRVRLRGQHSADLEYGREHPRRGRRRRRCCGRRPRGTRGCGSRGPLEVARPSSHGMICAKDAGPIARGAVWCPGAIAWSSPPLRSCAIFSEIAP